MPFAITKPTTATGEPNAIVTIEKSIGTSENDLSGANACTVYKVKIDCKANPQEDVSTRFFDSASPSVGTDDAELLLKGYKGKLKTYICKRGTPFTNLSVATVKNQGATAGSADPTGTVKVTIYIDDGSS